eukprot:snap_masked-scaffold_15-processed-gene-1.13-mRNA-1 protein AED:0.00 eAED:0.00 QI:0/-1/0/1/-1/1/1/0/766
MQRFSELKKKAWPQLKDILEVKESKNLLRYLQNQQNGSTISKGISKLLSQKEADIIRDSSLATFSLHVESRVASFLGEGFYTIGPCGEELISTLGLLVKPFDTMALHYRHSAAIVSKQLAQGRPLEDIILDRARGYTVSQLDPVTGGRHCAIGSGFGYDENEYYVTSTLASQAPFAVGRALGFSLRNDKEKWNSEKRVSIVSLGDGSVNNNMFLSAINFAQYSTFRGYRCPTLFVVSNNNICISLKGYGWLYEYLRKYDNSNLKVDYCDGNDLLATYQGLKTNLEACRMEQKPRILVLDNLKRRFGHAATDRQTEYYSKDEIVGFAGTESSNIVQLCDALVSNGYSTYEELGARLEQINSIVEECFGMSCEEPKISSREYAQKNLVSPKNSGTLFKPIVNNISNTNKKKMLTMRQCMTQFYDEVLASEERAVYVGEDVRHGGYYLVTQGLFAKYKTRVQDIPPDETMLFGLGVGYAQTGSVPIVEIPYAKYLDCGADVFFETCTLNWLTNGKTNSNGALIRLQGFDKGVFGGNYHTHNTLHMPAGLDVVCYSNGEDYVNGLRYSISQVKGGRIVMSVDSTNLLNLKSIGMDSKSKNWLQRYPSHNANLLAWDDIILYNASSNHDRGFQKVQLDSETYSLIDLIPPGDKEIKIIFSYGNGVPLAVETFFLSAAVHYNVVIVDIPYISGTPKALITLLEDLNTSEYKCKLVFADVCKEGASPLAGLIMRLKKLDLLKHDWEYTAAQNTYNPLGSTVTFLSKQDLLDAA